MQQTECRSCQWVEDPTTVIGGFLPVGKHSKWRVNHYQSGEAILGWLVLQPIEHQLTLDELSDETLDDLGSALRNVQRAMKRVWNEQFPDDLLERIHMVSFMESEFDEPPPAELFHVHIFLIPRSKLLGKVIREQLPEVSEKQYVAWHDYKMFRRIKKQDASDLRGCLKSRGAGFLACLSSLERLLYNPLFRQVLIEENVPWDELQKYINPRGEAGKQAWKDKIETFMNRLQEQLPKSGR